MWIQQRIRNGDLDLYKIAGDNNPADILTKADIPRDRMEHMLNIMNCQFEGGRATTAPQLRSEGGKKLFAVRKKSQQQHLPTGIERSRDSVRGGQLEQDQLKDLAAGAGKPSDWNWADELERELARGERQQAGERVEVLAAREETEEPEDQLTALGERLGSAGRGRAPLPSLSQGPRE